ncbi:MAG: DUF2971 domain-containing protein [Myxococcota bacterium]
MVWRYLDALKFLALLQTSSLFFARLDKMEDPFEGSVPWVNHEQRKAAYAKHQEERRAFFDGILEKNPSAEPIKQLRDRFLQAGDPVGEWYEMQRRWTGVNCWFMGEHESAAMWRLYMPAGHGVAVRSTIGRLKESLKNEPSEVYVGEVRYIDFSKDAILDNNSLQLLALKRKSFEHEREVRAIIWDALGATSGNCVLGEYGVNLPVDLEALIEGIFVAPQAPSWVRDAVAETVRRYGIGSAVIQSTLDSKPLY